MADFVFNIPQKILLSSYSASRIGEYTKDWGNKFVIIMEPVLSQIETGEKIIKPLKDRNIDFFIFSNIEGQAETKTIDSILKLARQAHVDGIIATGGSKVMNIARAVAALYNEERDIYTAIEKDDISCEPLPLICVPSVFRDRLFFTNKITVIDSRSSKLCIIHTQKEVSKAILLDPNLMISLSENQRASMLIETIAIAIEAYISPNSNIFSDMAAEKAIELLGLAANSSANLEVTTPQEELLCQGGLMACLAESTSSLGITSLLAICINYRYNINSTLTSSILLPHIIEDAAKFRVDKLAHIARLLKVTDEEADNAKATEDLVTYIRQSIAKYNLPSRLKDLSVTIEQLSLSAEDAGGLEFINSLPKSTTTDDLFTLIKAAY